ncbi:MAG: hypothetical protein DRR16_05905 [Candidatus Parabeggiatoa sp. nov. 3]|nr:MAG: hypothetical protein DRR00_32620 [Gammaproteobacteria bacterium]RKZ64216.1 MAG: hypothetical protein DRQ99_15835 [Gammaproteobacteria bacterium]RKZ88019.1 MAG: hypothetical protein DRR16_05905 [Gammaproteobacteria bacterium]
MFWIQILSFITSNKTKMWLTNWHLLAENKGNTVTSRINIKQKQTQPTDHTFPVYIIVVEFSKP